MPDLKTVTLNNRKGETLNYQILDKTCVYQGHTLKFLVCHKTITKLNKGYIDETSGNQIWSNMLARRRILPTKTFTDYLNTIK